MKLALLGAFLGTIAVVSALTAAGREEIYMNGPLQDGHQFMAARHARTGERYCDDCHVPVRGAADTARCMGCHYAVARVAADPGRKPVETPCLDCHLEHSRGEDPLVPRGERACRSCHPGAAESHRAKTYIAEQGIPLTSCLNAKGCHLNEYHLEHRYAPVASDFEAHHDKDRPGYDESRCIDCHGEPRELVDRYAPRFYQLGDATTPSDIHRLMSANGEPTSMHRVHIAKMNMACKDCHRMATKSVGSASASSMPTKKCCHCHSAPTTPPRMWCGLFSGAVAGS